MNRHSRRRVLLAALALVFCLSALPAAVAEEPPADTTGYTYSYELRDAKTTLTGTQFSLYVCGSEGAPPLHTGSIALGTTLPGVNADGLGFTPAKGYSTASFDGKVGAAFERGATRDGRPYLGFIWMAEQGSTIQPGEQLLGAFTLNLKGKKAEDVSLIPWALTSTGEEQLGKDLEDDVRDVLVGSIWRMENTSDPSVGYYQGYYAQPVTDSQGVTTGQQRTDIQGKWQALQITAYAEKNPISLAFYRLDGGAYETTPSLHATLDAGTSTGRFTVPVRFDALEYRNSAGTVVKSFQAGTYRLVISKQSHVTMTYEGLTLAKTGDGYAFFPELAGMSLTLPCGDVDKDGGVRQADRALLTRPGSYGSAVPAGGAGKNLDLLDLDGDGRVGQSDLAILISPANYSKAGKIVDLSPADGGDGT